MAQEETDLDDAELAEVGLLASPQPAQRPVRKTILIAALVGIGLAALVLEIGEPALGIEEKSLSRLLGLAEATETSTACLANEEMYAGMCYMSCRTLTNGVSPYRMNSQTCCKNMKLMCYFMRSWTTTSTGLAVGGGTASESQPHVPGAGGDCLENEEPFQGQCYQKCSILTNGSYPVRTGTMSCCSGETNGCATGAIPSVANSAYASGGGQGDQAAAHAPGDYGNPNVQTGESAIGQNCGETEESYNGICYQKCSIVSAGQMPYRKGPMTCCKSNSIFSFFSCMLPTNAEASPDFQTGAPIDGMTTGPHPPGMSAKCLTDEEEYLGMCYKKCSVLTSGTHPYRTGVNSCCKDQATTECDSQPEDVGVSVLYDSAGFSADGLPHGPYLTP